VSRWLRIGLPFLAVLIVFGLWSLSDQLIFIGPLDRATFGWGVVIPLWLLLPVAAAAAWSGLDDRPRTGAAVLLGVAAARRRTRGRRGDPDWRRRGCARPGDRSLLGSRLPTAACWLS
jgi:hypothetical protein